jgi:hypothetical protein
MMAMLVPSPARSHAAILLPAHGRLCPAPGYGRVKMRGREGSLILRAREDDASSGAQIEYRTVREVKTGYDDLSIVQSAETSSSKYAGFTLLVNSSGTMPPLAWQMNENRL